MPVVIEFQFGDRRIRSASALVMAIINRTPDSFYDRGATFADGTAMAAVRKAVADGADIVDIGGVKAGPGPDVDVAAEIARVIPFIGRVRKAFPELVISVDTWRGAVAEHAIRAGADLINDTWAGADPTLGEVAARFGTGYVCSHTGGLTPRSRPHRVNYADVVQSVLEQTVTQAEWLVACGVPRAGILIDPTHDFGKNTWHGLELLRRADELVASGWPVLMALSNKDFVGETLGVELGERLPGTLAATAVSAEAGVAAFRVHEVAATRSVVDTVADMLR